LFSFLLWVKLLTVLYVICNISGEWLHLYWLRVLEILRDKRREEVNLWYPIHQIRVLYCSRLFLLTVVWDKGTGEAATARTLALFPEEKLSTTPRILISILDGNDG